MQSCSPATRDRGRFSGLPLVPTPRGPARHLAAEGEALCEDEDGALALMRAWLAAVISPAPNECNVVSYRAVCLVYGGEVSEPKEGVSSAALRGRINNTTTSQQARFTENAEYQSLRNLSALGHFYFCDVARMLMFIHRRARRDLPADSAVAASSEKRHKGLLRTCQHV